MNDVKDENVQAWADLFNGLKEARAHFSASYRHALLGMAESLRVLQDAVQTNADQAVPPQASAALDLLRRGVLIWADRVPNLLEAASLNLAKREALITVKEVLLAELQRIETREGQSEQDKVKQDALTALLRVIDTQLEQEKPETSEQAEPQLRRVTID